MNSLFVKIFLYFLLAITLASAIGIVLTYTRDRDFPPLQNRHFAKQALTEYGREALTRYEQGGRPALLDYSKQLRHETHIRTLLFSANGAPLSKRRVRPELAMLLQQAIQEQQVIMAPPGGQPWLVSPLHSPSGQSFLIAVGLPSRPQMRDAMRVFAPHFIATRLPILLSVAAIICMLLARSLTAPIHKLRLATRQFAGGELSTRIGNQIKGRNEIADLGRDFDRMAERIEELVGSQQRLVRDISHELRSPLTRLSLALELARQRAGSAALGSLDRIEKEAGRLNEMIGQLLTLSLLESGGKQLQKADFELTDLLRKIVQDADFEAKGRGCTTELMVETEGIMINGDAELLGRAIENVVRNALHYTATGTSVAVCLKRLNEQQAQIFVRDRGPGVPGASLPHLFEPFYRVAAARDRLTGGTGIGLAIAERAITRHGGTIRATNHADGGLNMKIILPLSDEEQNDAPIPKKGVKIA